MRRTRPSYEKPSRISQGLVICFSIAIVAMAGWLAMTIMFSRDANTMAADDDTNIEETSAPPYVENVSPEPEKLSVTARLNAAYFEPLPRDYIPDAVTPSRSALPLAPLTEFPPPSARDPRYPASIVPTMPDVVYRGSPADEPPQAEVAIEATYAAPDFVPLPLPKPRRASIPVPRPRPHLDSEDQPGPDPSFFDLLVNRPR